MNCKSMKNVLITGASSGIGFAMAKAFLREGYFVFAHFHNNLNELESIESDSILKLKAELSDMSEADKLFEECLKARGSVDVLINNAGTYYAEELESVQEEVFDHIFNVNLKAPFRLSQLALASMKKNKWGRIINISSIGVKYGGSPNSALYSMTKSAMEAMTRSFAKAGAPYNVLVNCLRPGVVGTKLHLKDSGKNMEQRAKMIPLGRLAQPEEIAETALFVASGKSSFTTGAILDISGGE